MPRKRTYDREGHAHFVTFSCFRRRRLLDHDRSKRIILGVLNSRLSLQQGRCVGFVIMPDHVHALVRFPEHDQISHFMKQWKQRSSVQVKRWLGTQLPRYTARIDPVDPVWQARYYDFNVFTTRKMEEKLLSMHQNPVRAGLVVYPCDWPWSSARYYEWGRSVGVPVGWIDGE
jgi:putative transposase